ncbi:MAG: FAD-binding protein, partial [Verrucomicrobia bacterium]|nr:FAD-binding protein [Verrucomicrobiota bacterium]
RYGPLKDFIIGVRFVDGLGNYIRGGGKVVKNAAGFDFPKLFNGSLGRLSILTELSFKVFPEPQTYVTLQTRVESAKEALQIMPTLKGFDLEGVELDSKHQLSLRLGYQEPTMETRKRALESLIGNTLTMILGENEPELWQRIKRFAWLEPESCLFKTVTHPESALKMIESIGTKDWKTHLTNGGKTLYFEVDSSADIEFLETLLTEHKLTGLQLKGPVPSHPLIGNKASLKFVSRVQKALDPKGVFQSFSSSTPVTA